LNRKRNICLAVDICEQLKRDVTLDLRKADFIDDPQTNRMRSRAMRAPFVI